MLEAEEDSNAIYIVNTELMGDIGKEINKQYIYEYEAAQLV